MLLYQTSHWTKTERAIRVTANEATPAPGSWRRCIVWPVGAVLLNHVSQRFWRGIAEQLPVDLSLELKDRAQQSLAG